MTHKAHQSTWPQDRCADSLCAAALPLLLLLVVAVQVGQAGLGLESHVVTGSNPSSSLQDWRWFVDTRVKVRGRGAGDAGQLMNKGQVTFSYSSYRPSTIRNRVSCAVSPPSGLRVLQDRRLLARRVFQLGDEFMDL